MRADRETNRQIDRHTYRHADRRISTVINRNGIASSINQLLSVGLLQWSVAHV